MTYITFDSVRAVHAPRKPHPTLTAFTIHLHIALATYFHPLTLFKHTSTMSTAVAPGYTIHVAGLAPESTEDKLHDFFSFCGKLVSVNKTGTSADITFEKLSAMRTSL